MPILPKTVTLIMASVALVALSYTATADSVDVPSDPAVIEYINSRRATYNLPPFVWDPVLEKDAASKAREACPLVEWFPPQPIYGRFLGALRDDESVASALEEMKTAVKYWESAKDEAGFQLLAKPGGVKIGCAVATCTAHNTGSLAGRDFAVICKY